MKIQTVGVINEIKKAYFIFKDNPKRKDKNCSMFVKTMTAYHSTIATFIFASNEESVSE